MSKPISALDLSGVVVLSLLLGGCSSTASLDTIERDARAASEVLSRIDTSALDAQTAKAVEDAKAVAATVASAASTVSRVTGTGGQ